MQTPAFEETRPADSLLRHAASGLGKAYKDLAVAELAVSPGDVVLDQGCGPGRIRLHSIRRTYTALAANPVIF
jgi:ubiquinone/menaquinone biosynthesis C-methylase UbiE